MFVKFELRIALKLNCKLDCAKYDRVNECRRTKQLSDKQQVKVSYQSKRKNTPLSIY